MTDYPTREYIVRETTYPDATKQELIGELVRCKDCKHWIPYDWMFSEVWQSRNMCDYPENEIGCEYCDMSMASNDFCSRGERKGGDHHDEP